MPPLVRSLPHVESLSLFRAEESQAEADIREGLNLCGAFPEQSNQVEEDVVMKDFAPSETQQVSNRQPARVAEPPLPQSPLPLSVTNTSTKPQLAASVVLLPVTIEPSRPTLPEPESRSPLVVPQPVAALAQNEDDEEIPAINLDSDSDEE